MQRKRLLVVLGAVLFALGLIALPLSFHRSTATANPDLIETGPLTSDPGAQPKTSHRLIVQLSSPSLSERGSGKSISQFAVSRLQTDSQSSQTYINQLKTEQAAFMSAMQAALPDAKVSTYLNESGQSVQATYQVVFNGMALDPGKTGIEEARRTLMRLPGVKAVFLDYAHQPDMYASLPLINAQALWNNPAVGGIMKGGQGVKVASMDGGVYGGTSSPAPMFDGAGFSYPAGWPAGGLGVAENNNGKVIASRAYFRTWDPPAVGDQHVWPGVNGTSHGVHTASTMAGNQVVASYQGITQTISGVAPAAWVMSYRVFYYSVTGDGSFYDAEGIAALEDIVKDGADVVNNSWGGGPASMGGAFDPLDTALTNAWKAGVFVSMSAGNSGPSHATSDHPSDDYINVAASTTTGTYAAGRVSVTAPAPISTTLQNKPFGIAEFGQALPVGTVAAYPFITAKSVDGTNIEGCKAWVGTPFTGKAAVISRGSCNFSQKAYYAQQAGAQFVVIYNNADDTTISMAAGAFANQVTISSISVGKSTGLGMESWYITYGNSSTLEVNTVAYQVGNTPDVIASFSSRGPGIGSVLKPDIAAPGVNILAQGFTPGVSGEARHKGWGQASGTSMAAPHVAGSAALLRQIHPTWSNAAIKSALMSTSKYLDIYTVDGSPAQPLDMGAGRLDLTRAADPGVILDPPSLSFGKVLQGSVKKITVKVTSVANTTETYSLSFLNTSGGFPGVASLPGYSVSPQSLTLTPGASGSFTITFDPSTAGKLGDHQGYVILDGTTHDAHLPAWARATYLASADVLVIDNDGSSSLGLKDYASTYTNALTELGYSFTVLDVDDLAGEPKGNFLNEVDLNAFKAVIYYTGQNLFWDGYFTVHTPLSVADTYRLNEYAANGGAVIAMGQDMAYILNSGLASGGFFYGTTLGGKWLSDSISGEVITPTFTIQDTGEMPMKGVQLDLSNKGDGSADQFYVDEIAASITVTSPSTVDPSYVAVLKYPALTNVDEGTVGMAHRQQPTLEKPGVSYQGSSIYTTFGLEGVTNNTGYTTRGVFLKRALDWVLDKPQAQIGTTYEGLKVTFKATLTSNIAGVTGLSYRWDFGDGTTFTSFSASDSISHTYERLAPYQVRVEVLDSIGNHVVAAKKVYGIAYLPLIGR